MPYKHKYVLCTQFLTIKNAYFFIAKRIPHAPIAPPLQFLWDRFYCVFELNSSIWAMDSNEKTTAVILRVENSGFFNTQIYVKSIFFCRSRWWCHLLPRILDAEKPQQSPMFAPFHRITYENIQNEVCWRNNRSKFKGRSSW